MVKEPRKLVRYVTPEHFAQIYESCHVATKPAGYPFSPEDWWQALLVFVYMTGWRIGEPLALRREDLDLDHGTAVTRAEDNKGGRDELVPLHPVVIDHLRRINCFEPVVFPWPHHERTLWLEFGKIQDAAGLPLESHYGFHDIRRSFATLNHEQLSADVLQRLMRHKSYSTTQRYVNMARSVTASVERLHVPDFLRRAN
jgi:integrase